MNKPFFSNAHDDCVNKEEYDPTYHVHTPLIQHNKKFKNISTDNLRKLMHNKSIAWYTGAGISATVVPTMASLEKSLGMISLIKDENSSDFISNILINPEHTALIMRSFYEQCLYGKPTVAHKAITSYIQCNKNCMLFTENLDILHEHAEINPIRINDPISFKNNVSEQTLKNIDIFICVGLSHDDRGLLGYYKHHNPAGIIIAQCLDQPKYLGETDYFLQGDAQEIIPALIKF